MIRQRGSQVPKKVVEDGDVLQCGEGGHRGHRAPVHHFRQPSGKNPLLAASACGREGRLLKDSTTIDHPRELDLVQNEIPLSNFLEPSTSNKSPLNLAREWLDFAPSTTQLASSGDSTRWITQRVNRAEPRKAPKEVC
jgi:hypothetical protein